MENNHLTYFKVENFKKFDSLEVNDIGQFNLIVGDNNVGKTCLLEALTIDFHAKRTISTLHYIYQKRGIIIDSDLEYLTSKEDFNFNFNLIGLCQKDIEKPISFYKSFDNRPTVKFEISNLKNINPVSEFELNKFIEKTNLFQYKGINQISKNWLVFKKGVLSEEKKIEVEFICDVTSSYYKDFYFNLDYIPLIKINDFNTNDILLYYKEIIKNPKDELRLIEIIKTVFNSMEINRFSIFDYFNHSEYLQISTNEKPDYHPINEYGDGFIRILTIIFELFYNKTNYILIDEFEVGIHHKKQKDFWIVIFKVCKELNIQLFATTHSKECIEAYCSALQELDFEKNGKVILLQEEKGKIASYTFETRNLDLSFDYRG